MRRSEKEILGRRNVLALLNQCDILRIGLCHLNKPYIVPMLFAATADREPVYIYLHSAQEGRKMDMIRRSNRVCFEADRAFRIIEAKEACGWSCTYQSVIGEGIIQTVTDEAEKIEALDILMVKYGFKGELVYNPDTFQRAAVLRITVETITGKSSG